MFVREMVDRVVFVMSLNSLLSTSFRPWCNIYIYMGMDMVMGHGWIQWSVGWLWFGVVWSPLRLHRQADRQPTQKENRLFT